MNLRKKMIGGTALALIVAMATPVMAMPTDIRVAEEVRENEIKESNYLELIEDYYVATGAGNVRVIPHGEVIGVLDKGERYYVTAYRMDCGWYKIKGFGTSAYVYQDFLASEEEVINDRQDENSEEEEVIANLDLMMMANVDVNMREEPNGKIVGVLKKGTDIHVTGNLERQLWYRCKNKDGETVYIYDDYLLPDFPQTMKATHVLNIRSFPSIGSQVVGTLDIGDKVKVSGIEDGWYKYTYNEKGDIGYSYSDYMAAVE